MVEQGEEAYMLELLGSLVKLKAPYVTHRGLSFNWGIIVTHIDPSWQRQRRVIVFLYDDAGQLYMGTEHAPMPITLSTDQFQVWSLNEWSKPTTV